MSHKLIQGPWEKMQMKNFPLIKYMGQKSPLFWGSKKLLESGLEAGTEEKEYHHGVLGELVILQHFILKDTAVLSLWPPITQILLSLKTRLSSLFLETQKFSCWAIQHTTVLNLPCPVIFFPFPTDYMVTLWMQESFVSPKEPRHVLLHIPFRDIIHILGRKETG